LFSIAVQQLHPATGARNQTSVTGGVTERKNSSLRHHLTDSASDLSESCSTPRWINANNSNTLLYTHVIAFTLYELETITKSFRTDYILGEGGFGTVYKGYIDENVRVGLKSLPVAVKVLNKEGLQGHREWLVRLCNCFWNFYFFIFCCDFVDFVSFFGVGGGEFSWTA
jgi:hypothetical protein